MATVVNHSYPELPRYLDPIHDPWRPSAIGSPDLAVLSVAVVTLATVGEAKNFTREYPHEMIHKKERVRARSPAQPRLIGTSFTSDTLMNCCAVPLASLEKYPWLWRAVSM